MVCVVAVCVVLTHMAMVPAAVMRARVACSVRQPLLHGLGGEPAPHVGAAHGRVVQSTPEQPVGVERPMHRRQSHRARIEFAQALDEAACGRVGQIGLGYDNAVGDRGLLHRFGVGVERGGAGSGVDGGDHRLQAQRVGERRVGHQRLQDRRRIGQAGGFDDDALERHHGAGGAPRQQVAGGAHQVAAHGAANAAAVERDHLLLAGFDQQVVETDGAELVDDHRGACQRRVAQQVGKKRGLAAAEKARDDRERNRRRCHAAPGSGPSSGCAPIMRRPAGASGARSSRSWRKRPGNPACRLGGIDASGPVCLITAQPSGIWWCTRTGGPLVGVMTNPAAAPAWCETRTEMPQMRHAPARTREIRASHRAL